MRCLCVQVVCLLIILFFTSAKFSNKPISDFLNNILDRRSFALLCEENSRSEHFLCHQDSKVQDCDGNLKEQLMRRLSNQIDWLNTEVTEVDLGNLESTHLEGV